jgi:hypothetical protein
MGAVFDHQSHTTTTPVMTELNPLPASVNPRRATRLAELNAAQATCIKIIVPKLACEGHTLCQ